MKKNIKTLLFISIFAIIITSCVKDLKDFDISMVTSYTGMVVEQSTMQAIEGVKVMVTNGEKIYADTETDSNGNFMLSNVNMDELNDGYYLFLDGSAIDLPSKKESLKGLGMRNYDYKKIPLYDKTSQDILPIVNLVSVGNVSNSSAECTASVSYNNDISFNITDRGFVWSTMQNPSLERNDSHVTVGGGTGSFSAMLEGLSSTNVYYVRAYATNKFGTAYSEQKKMTSAYLSLPTFNYDGRTYRVAPSPGNVMDWSSANSYCNNYSIDGITGWKLPTKDELVQMYSMRNSIGGFNMTYGIYYSNYWSSTEYNLYNHYGVSFYNGSVEVYSNSYTYNCRPIRVEN